MSYLWDSRPRSLAAERVGTAPALSHLSNFDRSRSILGFLSPMI